MSGLLRENVTDHRSRLEDAVAMWGTPTTRDWKDTGNMENVPENGLLGRMALNWSTPRATDGEKGGPNQTFGAGGTPVPGGRMTRSGNRSDEPLLKGQAMTVSDMWQTPRSHETGDYQYSRGDHSKPVPTLTGQASFHQAHPIYTVGGIPSKTRRSLNPLFVEWLMGWPPGWTLLAWTDFACSAMELSVWKQRMRFALLQLGLPPEGPPVQRDLFG